MRPTPELSAADGLAKLATYPYAVLTWVEPNGYPVSVAVDASVDADAGTVTFERPAGLAVPMDLEVSLTGSHIRPQPGYGYDERRHVTVWGRALAGRRRSPGARPGVGLGLGRGRGPVLRVLGAVDRQGAPLLRRAVARAWHARETAPVAAVPRPAHDPPALPERDDRAGRARHRDRRKPRRLRPPRGDPHDHRGMLRPARDQREQRRLRHRPGRRRRQRHADASSAVARASSSTAS